MAVEMRDKQQGGKQKEYWSMDIDSAIKLVDSDMNGLKKTGQSVV